MITVLWFRELDYEYILSWYNRCKQEARFLTPDDLITVSNFYAVASTRRLGAGHLHGAADAGMWKYWAWLAW